MRLLSWLTIRLEGVSLGRERADDEAGVEADVVRVGDRSAEAVALAG
jgi:hypothetical protein